MGCGSSQPKEDGVEKPEAKPPQTDNAAAAPPSDELQKAALAAPTSSPADAVKAVEELQASDGVANQNLTKGQTPPARGAASDAGNGAPRGDVEEGSPASINSADPVQLMKLEAKQEVLKGHPYISNRYGPPRPGCQDERLKTLRAIQSSLVGKDVDPDITNLLNIATSLFGTESAVVTLVEDDKFKVHASAGVLGAARGAELPWLTGICGFSLTPAHHEVLVIEDMAADARFNAEVRGGFDRFYCGAPLVASNGHRLGTMCLGNSQPKTLTAHQINILCNMAEMVVRHVEKAWVAEIRRNTAVSDTANALKRSPAAYARPLLVVTVEGDGSSGDWSILYANSSAEDLLGVTIGPESAKPFWEVARSAMRSAAPWTPFEAAVKGGSRFSATCELQLDKAGSDKGSLWRFDFRPAEKDAVDGDHQLVGVPAWVNAERPSPAAASGVGPGSRMYVVSISEAAKLPLSGGSAGSDGSLTSILAPTSIPACFAGLELGPIIGKGSYGRVYRGWYNDLPVAVKIMDSECVTMNDDGEPLEAVVTGSKHHDHLVQTIGWHVTPTSDEAGSQTWLLLEYCDMPCLQDAMDRGLFREGEPRQSSPPKMGAICHTAYEVACGMAALHAQNVVHGDLKGGNVLLRSADNPRGFEAKVADFGLARNLGPSDRLQTTSYGTITHCSPELLLNSTVTKEIDVWAFGVMLWELFHGARAWAGLSHPQIMHAVGIVGTRLTFDTDRETALPAHDVFFGLAEACMAANPKDRPSFADIHPVLKASAEAWDKLPQGPNHGAAPSSLVDTNCTRCAA